VKSARVQSYSLVVEFQEIAAISQKLAILNVSDSKNALGWVEVVGEVENQGDIPSKYTQVTGTFYDADGKVIYVAFTFTDPSKIPVGARYGFKITVGSDERSYRIARYSLIAESESSRFTSVPEWRSPVLVVGIVLLLTAIVVRRQRTLMGSRLAELILNRPNMSKR